MSIEDTIAADQAAVTAAQAALDAANETLAADQAKLAAIQPHLSLLARIEAEFEQVDEAVKERVSALVGEMRALFQG